MYKKQKKKHMLKLLSSLVYLAALHCAQFVEDI